MTAPNTWQRTELTVEQAYALALDVGVLMQRPCSLHTLQQRQAFIQEVKETCWQELGPHGRRLLARAGFAAYTDLQEAALAQVPA